MPALPGGYTVGEKVFYTGSSKTATTGHKVVHAQQGEVTGPAALERYIGKGVSVRFPGNKGNVECWLTSVRRLRAAPAATPPPAPHTREAVPTPRAPALWLNSRSPVAPTPSSSTAARAVA